MKSYNHLFEKLITNENLLEAVYNAAKHKRSRPDVREVLKNPQFYVDKLRAILVGREYTPATHKAVRIYDGSSKKMRLIIKPKFLFEQIIQHAIIQVLKPIFLKGMYPFSCGSIPGRGCHYGKRYLKKVINKNSSSPELRYVLKLDIRHFYQNIDTEKIRSRLVEVIHDTKMLEVIGYVLNSNVAEYEGEQVLMGMPIGYFTSQWMANWFLQDLDHFIKEQLKVKFYVRYVDDMVLLAKNKKELYTKYREIEDFLSRKGLTVKNNWRIFKFDYLDKTGNRTGFPTDFMGFKFYRDKITLRKSILLKASRKALRISKKVEVTAYDASQLLSYYGWFKHTDTHGAFEKYIASRVDMVEMKRLIRRRSKLCA